MKRKINLGRLYLCIFFLPFIAAGQVSVTSSAVAKPTSSLPTSQDDRIAPIPTAQLAVDGSDNEDSTAKVSKAADVKTATPPAADDLRQNDVVSVSASPSSSDIDPPSSSSDKSDSKPTSTASSDDKDSSSAASSQSSASKASPTPKVNASTNNNTSSSSSDDTSQDNTNAGSSTSSSTDDSQPSATSSNGDQPSPTDTPKPDSGTSTTVKTAIIGGSIVGGLLCILILVKAVMSAQKRRSSSHDPFADDYAGMQETNAARSNFWSAAQDTHIGDSQSFGTAKSNGSLGSYHSQPSAHSGYAGTPIQGDQAFHTRPLPQTPSQHPQYV